MTKIFNIRGKLNPQESRYLGFFGVIIFVLAWFFISYIRIVPESILPSPVEVLKSFPKLIFNDHKTSHTSVQPSIITSMFSDRSLIPNVLYSIKLNIFGYMEAIFLAIPLGFIIGVFPMFRGLMSKIIDSTRFIPLTAVTGIFIATFGIQSSMKIHFLAFGIFVYLLPVVVQRIDEVRKEHKDMMFTLGSSQWNTIRHVYFPSVMSRLSDDIRIITAISWTYIIVAELINRVAGIGSMIYLSERGSDYASVYACLIVIIIIGMIQDRSFLMLDKLMFKFKHI